MRPASPCPSEATLRPRTLASWASFRCSICVFRLTSSGTRRVYTVARPFRSVIAHPTMPSRLPKEVAQASSGPILMTMQGHLTHGRLRAWLLGRQRTQNESAEREEVLVQQAATLCAELSDGAGPPLTCCGLWRPSAAVFMPTGTPHHGTHWHSARSLEGPHFGTWTSARVDW